MFAVPKYIAHKTVKKVIINYKRPLSTLTNDNSRLIKQKTRKHNQLNVRIALERLLGALINCSLLQSGEGVRREGGKSKWDKEVQ